MHYDITGEGIKEKEYQTRNQRSVSYPASGGKG
jgi:hypothetical protein